MSNNTRTEKDPLGTLEVPADSLYGVQTLRAVRNFPISSVRPLPAFVVATVHIKRAAALTHKETGRLEPKLAQAQNHGLSARQVAAALRLLENNKDEIRAAWKTHFGR